MGTPVEAMSMRMSRFSAIPVLATALAVAGCEAPPQPSGPTLGTAPVQTPEQFEHLWRSTEDALLAFNFDVDRRDRVQGIITTYPETSAHFFELWRAQPTPAYYWWESNLHTIQRQAEVYIRPSSPGTYQIEVKVDRYRRSMEERQVDNAAAAMRLFSGQAPTVSGQMIKPSESSNWIHLGRDAFAERTILDAIIARYGKPTTAPSG